MKTLPKSYYSYLLLFCFAALVSCDKDDDGPDAMNPGSGENDSLFVVGLGVAAPSGETTWFLLGTDDLMTGTLSVEGQGTLQDGYRDFAYGGNTFYSIGGLGITDVNTVTSAGDSVLSIASGLTFPFQLDGFRPVGEDGSTMLGISQPQTNAISTDITFYEVDIATNTITNTGTVPKIEVYDDPVDDSFTTGMAVSGDKLYQTFYPVEDTTFVTAQTDTQYVAIYSYPEFALDTVLTNTQFGPAGGFNTRSGIFAAEGGNIYTISHSNFGYTQATKPAGILKIPAGSAAFDSTYSFNTETAPNGGKIIHAIYVGDNKLFAAVSTKELEGPDANGFGNVYTDSNLRLSIVDLEAQTITVVTGAPEYTGNGGRSFAAFQDRDFVYSSITDDSGAHHIYRTDINTAVATKGAEVETTFVGGIARLD